MGLLKFWKNKASDQSAVPENQQPFSDLPAIDGNSAGSVDGSNVQNFAGQLPPLDDTQTNSKSISFNVPTFDFSLPPSDDEPVMENKEDNKVSTPEIMPPPVPPTEPKPQIDPLDPQDLNHLFIQDDDWKEPDWNNFDPYPQEKIEEPNPTDFGEAELPGFEVDNSIPEKSEPISEPTEPFKETFTPMPKPLELFIRGKAYNRVFIELDQMNKTLDIIDSQLDKYEEMLKKEEPLLGQAKDQMEYLYKRINQIDKKIFVQ